MRQYTLVRYLYVVSAAHHLSIADISAASRRSDRVSGRKGASSTCM